MSSAKPIAKEIPSKYAQNLSPSDSNNEDDLVESEQPYCPASLFPPNHEKKAEDILNLSKAPRPEREFGDDDATKPGLGLTPSNSEKYQNQIARYLFQGS
ncbi:hypothetical protein SJAG_04861 [Schizosaccharomyces japonicus yFS275]|uniref:Uncharacterized protein n=1 Tax=Schizosaccharomyces japonicus (strain yFS275 / FY16936) TaxID=402676 RepID=B6K7Y8_SCHJY|nr:hypothetical protein SJAG_04861 [Schizosaccharomyces japonicus yFS275]EEB09642.2 hypothetical protein SJAG_04861 [Schizosaccharomyces japonicus yFS275]